jgi:hypothetical protein
VCVNKLLRTALLHRKVANGQGVKPLLQNYLTKAQDWHYKPLLPVTR